MWAPSSSSSTLYQWGEFSCRWNHYHYYNVWFSPIIGNSGSRCEDSGVNHWHNTVLYIYVRLIRIDVHSSWWWQWSGLDISVFTLPLLFSPLSQTTLNVIQLYVFSFQNNYKTVNWLLNSIFCVCSWLGEAPVLMSLQVCMDMCTLCWR